MLKNYPYWFVQRNNQNQGNEIIGCSIGPKSGSDTNKSWENVGSKIDTSLET